MFRSSCAQCVSQVSFYEGRYWGYCLKQCNMSYCCSLSVACYVYWTQHWGRRLLDKLFQPSSPYEPCLESFWTEKVQFKASLGVQLTAEPEFQISKLSVIFWAVDCLPTSYQAVSPKSCLISRKWNHEFCRAGGTWQFVSSQSTLTHKEWKMLQMFFLKCHLSFLLESVETCKQDLPSVRLEKPSGYKVRESCNILWLGSELPDVDSQ